MTDAEIVANNRRHCMWPRLYYGVIPFLARKVGAQAVAEIGVAFGYHAEDILAELRDVTYDGVDPYAAGYDPDDPHCDDVRRIFAETDTQRAMDRLYAAVTARLAVYGSRAVLHRRPSVEAASGFADATFDVVFVDGGHTYEAVRDDLAAWWPKVRPGGILCGDDYVLPPVERATTEFAGMLSHTLQFVSKAGTDYPIWLLDKPRA
jgi:predicted O-methyltransferase YrrM